MATFYLDFENGNDSNDGTTFANRWKTITSGATAARLTPGDTIRVMKSPDPVSLGVNATFTKLSYAVTLASAVTTNISTCETAWTASANVTTSINGDRKEGSWSSEVTTADAFGTGMMAYQATGALNLSAYSKISLWVKSTVALAASSLRIDLCSDSAGATPVNSLTINKAIDFASSWHPITIDNGAALGSNINSIAIYALTDFGAATIYLDNIFATNNISLTSLIGTSSSATSRDWFALRSVNGTSVYIDADPNSAVYSTYYSPYAAATATVAAYIREPIWLSSSQTVNESGTATAPYTFSGGWNTGNMSNQNGMTFVMSPYLTTINASNYSYIKFEYFGFTNSETCYRGGSYHTISNCHFSNSAGYLIDIQNKPSCIITDTSCYGGLYQYISMPRYSYFNNVYIAGNYFGFLNGDGNKYADCTIANAQYGLYLEKNNEAQNLTVNNCNIAFINCANLAINKLSCDSNSYVFYGTSANVNNLTSTNNSTFAFANADIFPKLSISNYSTYKGVQYEGSSIVYYNVSTPVHGSATLSWRHDVIARKVSSIPIVQKLQPFAVASSTQVTFTIWTRRTSTSVVGRVRVLGGVISGVDTDVTATSSAAINTWEQLTVVFTPSAAGVVIVQLESYTTDGTTGNVFFGDALVSQA